MTIAEKLTQATGNRIDFYNIGGLATQRTRDTLWGLWTHYSWRELFIRGGIVTTTVLFGLVGTCMGNDQGYSLVKGCVGAGVGFFASHSLALVSTIIRRNNIKNAALELHQQAEQILSKLESDYSGESKSSTDIKLISSRVRDVCSHIKNLSLPVKKKGDAVQNLITIKKLSARVYEELSELSTSLQGENIEVQSILNNARDFWRQSNKEIIDQFTPEKSNNTNLKFN